MPAAPKLFSFFICFHRSAKVVPGCEFGFRVLAFIIAARLHAADFKDVVRGDWAKCDHKNQFDIELAFGGPANESDEAGIVTVERKDSSLLVKILYDPGKEASGADGNLVACRRRKADDRPNDVAHRKRPGVSFQTRFRQAAMSKQTDLLQGTLEMLILKSVSLEPMHGYGILVRIQQLSGGRLQIQQGSLYPALYRLETRGFIHAEWGESDHNRKAKYCLRSRCSISARTSRTVVGAVENMKIEDLKEPIRPQVFLPFQQSPSLSMYVAVRSSGGAAEAAATIQNAAAVVDKSQPVYDVATMGKRIAVQHVANVIVTQSISLFAIIALFLAAIIRVQPGQNINVKLDITGSGFELLGAFDPAWRSDGTRVGYRVGNCVGLWSVPAMPTPGVGIGNALAGTG